MNHDDGDEDDDDDDIDAGDNDDDDEFISFASLKLAPSGFEQSLKFCFAPQNHNNYLHSI